MTYAEARTTNNGQHQTTLLTGTKIFYIEPWKTNHFDCQTLVASWVCLSSHVHGHQSLEKLGSAERDSPLTCFHGHRVVLPPVCSRKTSIVRVCHVNNIFPFFCISIKHEALLECFSFTCSQPGAASIQGGSSFRQSRSICLSHKTHLIESESEVTKTNKYLVKKGV